MVEPTGVEAAIETRIPVNAQNTEIAHAAIVTARKFLNTDIADTAGKMMSAEMRSVPTRFIASTMVIAITAAIAMLYIRVFIPEARAKSPSNVIAKMRL